MLSKIFSFLFVIGLCAACSTNTRDLRSVPTTPREGDLNFEQTNEDLTTLQQSVNAGRAEKLQLFEAAE